VISRTRRSFWQHLEALPKPIQRIAREKFAIWQREPFQSSLQFKELASGVWSVRVNDQYRALARRKGELIVWFWIGSHAEYDRLITQK